MLCSNLLIAQPWEHTYGGGGFQQGYNMIETYDKGFAILGATGSSTNRRILLFKTDINGNVLWTKTIGSSVYVNNATGIDNTNDGGLILAGITTQYDSMGGAFVLKLNECGEKQWCKIYGLPNHYDFAADIYQLSDGNFIVLSNYFGPSDPNINRIWLMKLDAFGNILWLNDYSHYYNPDSWSLLVTSDNGFLINGFSYVPNPGDTVFAEIRTIIIKVDSTGSESWNVPYGVNDYFYSKGGATRETPDGGYLTLCTHRDSINLLKNYSYVFKTDMNGNVQWGNQIAIGDSSKGLHDLDMIALNDSSSITLSQITDTVNSGIYRLKILKIDTAGNILDSMTYGYNTFAPSGRIAKTQDGKLIICSVKDIGGSNYDIYVLKLNEHLQLDTIYNISLNYDSLCNTGITTGTITLDTMSYVGVPEVKEKKEILVYPNPVSDNLTLEVSFPSSVKKELSIYNLLGEKILNENFTAQKHSLNVSAFTTGIYFIEVRTEKTRITRRIIKM